MREGKLPAPHEPSALLGTMLLMARAETGTPRVWVKTGTLAATAVASAPAPAVVVGPFAATIAYVVAQPHYHLPADHDDPIARAFADVGLVLVVLFVGWKLVACRLMRPASSS
jgi:hypothetical protein